VVEPAPPERQTAAFQLVFQEVAEMEREARVLNALRMVRAAELDPDGVLIARRGSRLVGALVCLPIPGGSGLVWPPRTLNVPERTTIEDALMQHASQWLRQRGCKLGQALLAAFEAPSGPALERNGFKHITGLCYMHHLLDFSPHAFDEPERLVYHTYDTCDRRVFEDTLVRTYVGSLDCPEVTGLRNGEEIITGHRAQGRHDPGRWWLARAGDRPVGVLLLAEMPEWEAWDISYVGLVPEARGRGYGKELVRRALRTGWEASAGQVTVSVDTRNSPACELYRKMGFQTFDTREVYLALWPTP
jgi:ribosomal protein S18 acetylase RimI-like enzyme